MLFRIMKWHTQPWTNSCCHNRNIFAHLMGCVGAGLIKFQLYTQSFGATWIVRILVREAMDAIGTICDGLVWLVKLCFYYHSIHRAIRSLSLSLFVSLRASKLAVSWSNPFGVLCKHNEKLCQLSMFDAWCAGCLMIKWLFSMWIKCVRILLMIQAE